MLSGGRHRLVRVGRNLPDAVNALQRSGHFGTRSGWRPSLRATGSVPDFADVHGQLLARRALEIAAAGGHNTLLVGPPGAGKTMMARRLGRLAADSPRMRRSKSPRCTRWRDCSPWRGTLDVETLQGTASHGLGCRARRRRHHSAARRDQSGPSRRALPRRNAEFSRQCAEVLRQPLEEGIVRIGARRGRDVPRGFMLVGAMNPCPCGYSGTDVRPCRCTPQQVDRYRARLSGPLRDRIGLAVSVAALHLVTWRATQEASLVAYSRAGSGGAPPSAAARWNVELKLEGRRLTRARLRLEGPAAWRLLSNTR